MRELNFLYCSLIDLSGIEFSHEGFEWLDCRDVNHSVVAYLRRGCKDKLVVIVLNFAMVERPSYRVGVPTLGLYKEVLNSNSQIYGGSSGGTVNSEFCSDSIVHMGHPYSLLLDLPPLTGIIISLLEQM